MSKSLGLLAAVGLASLAGAGRAATFDAANSSLQILLGALPPAVIPGNPGGAQSGPGPTVTEFGAPTKAFGPVNVDLPDSLFTGVPEIIDLRIAGLAKPLGTTIAVLQPGGGGQGGFGGIAPLSGTATICVLHCVFGLPIQVPLTPVGNLAGPLFLTALGAPLTITPGMDGWTTGQVTVTGLKGGAASSRGPPRSPSPGRTT